MQTPIVPENSRGRPSSSGKRAVITELNFDRPSVPIAEFAARPDFPQCTYGEFVDIGGYTGVVVEITSQSLKVTSPESTTQSFNFNVLRRLYGPAPQPEPEPRGRRAEPPVPVQKIEEAPEAAPKKQVITEPNFNRPPKPITEFAGRSDFPKCAFGEFIEIAGFTGVVVEIVHESLKVRSPQDITRSYGVSTLRKLYGR